MINRMVLIINESPKTFEAHFALEIDPFGLICIRRDFVDIVSSI
jgi:hypothetical protein